MCRFPFPRHWQRPVFRHWQQLLHRKMRNRFALKSVCPCALSWWLPCRVLQVSWYWQIRSSSFCFRVQAPLAGHLLQAGGISVIFYSISTLSNAVLQGIDRMRIPVRNASVALVLHAGVIAVGMFGLKLNIYGICVGTIAFSLIMCILNGMSVRKYSGFKPDVTKTFIKPAIASCDYGGCSLCCIFVCHKVSHSNAVSTVIAVLVGMIVYAAALLLIKGLTEEELHSFPKGELLIRIAKKFRLL